MSHTAPVPGTSPATSSTPARPSNHPEAVRARTRAALVTRTDTDWAAYGFTPADTARWTHAGIPATNAPLAAMCRDATRIPDFPITPDRLQHPISGGATILDALLAGMNIMLLQEKLARQLGRLGSLTRIPHDAIYSERAQLQTVSGRKAIDRVADGDLTAMPVVLDFLTRLGRSETDLLAPATQFHAEAAAYTGGGDAGPLLLAAAHAHGIYTPGPVLHAFAAATPPPDGTAEQIRAAADVYTRNTNRHMFYANPDMAELINAAATDMVTTAPLTAADLPAPHGMLWLSAFTDDTGRRTAARILAWAVGPRETAVITYAKTYTLSGAARGNNTYASAGRPTARLILSPPGADTPPLLDARLDPTGQALPSLLAFLHLLRHAAPAVTLPLTVAAPLTPAGAPGIPVTPSSAPGSADTITLIYPHPDTPGPADTGTPRTPRTHQWAVRGHWRRHWYPSSQTHQLIWISDHVSGNRAGPLLHTEKITILRP